MENLFRKYFWVVHLAFLALAAYFGAKTVNALIVGKYAPVPDFAAGATQPVAAAPKPSERPRLNPEALSKITGVELPKPPPTEETGAVAAVDFDSQEPVKSSLRVRLVGTMVANRPEWSMANIEDPGAKSSIVMVGDDIQSAVVTDIQRLRVIINNNGRKEYIDQEVGEGAAPVASAPVAPKEATAASGIKPTGESTFEIPRDELNKSLANLSDIGNQARIVPAFKDGVSTGFKLFSIRPDSLYSKIGIQNGDVVKKINGFDINSPERALEVYSKLKDAGRIEVELERGGNAKRLTYNVR